jgi:23S rRNA (guanosine2251-2'-O)-methyltransferase
MEQYRYGKHAVESSIRSGNVTKVFLSTNFKDPVILALLQQKKLPVERIEDERLQKLVDRANHQGIVAQVKPFLYTEWLPFIKRLASKEQPLLVLLDGIEDPQNLGAIIRTAVGYGVDGLIIKKDRQVEVTSTVAKIASGALDHLPIIQVTNLSQTIATLKENRFWVVATSLAESQDYRSVDYRGPIAIIIGHEGQGITRLVLENSDFKVKIPIQNLDSFNASTSTAILLAEVYRQRFPLK